MAKFIKRTKEQNKALHALLSKNALMDEKADLVLDVTDSRTDHSSEMSFGECNALIERLGGDKIPPARSRRAVQYHRQKHGVTQIETARQWHYIKDLWFKFPDLMDSGIRTDESLEKFCLRMIKELKPSTTKKANVVFEAIKSMNAREKKKRNDDPPPNGPAKARRVA